MARFNWPYVDVGPIGTNQHVSALVFSATPLLMVCRIAHLVSIVNGRRRLASGCLGVGSVPHAPSRKLLVHGWACPRGRNRKVRCSLSQMWKVIGWVHQIKQPQVDKGKGQMGMVDLEPDEEEAQVQYQADVHHLVESSEAITHSFKDLVLLLVEWLPMPMSGNMGSGSLDEEGMENVEE